MKVFMLGWEFPPFISGGLGTACYGLTKAMDQLGIKVIFVLPKVVDSKYASHVRLLTPKSVPGKTAVESKLLKNIKFYTINSWLRPYSAPNSYQNKFDETLLEKRTISGRCNFHP